MLQGAIWHGTVHLDAARLRRAEPACPFCRGTRRAAVWPLQETPRVELLECAGCAAVSASPMPTDAALAEYYDGYYDAHTRGAEAPRVTIDLVEKLAAHIGTVAVRRLAPRGELTVLDFGGGDGSVAIRLAERMLAAGRGSRARIAVVDYNEQPATPADARVEIERHADLGEVTGRPFQVVIASGIIEHLPEPRPALEALLDALAPGGVFYARTPFMVPLGRLLRRFGRSLDFTFPGHVHDLGQRFWEGVPAMLGRPGRVEILVSRPSLVETAPARHPLRTLAAYAFKAPWHVFGRRYGLVGGWEVFLRRTDTPEPTE